MIQLPVLVEVKKGFCLVFGVGVGQVKVFPAVFLTDGWGGWDRSTGKGGKGERKKGDSVWMVDSGRRYLSLLASRLHLTAFCLFF